MDKSHGMAHQQSSTAASSSRAVAPIPMSSALSSVWALQRVSGVVIGFGDFHSSKILSINQCFERVSV